MRAVTRQRTSAQTMVFAAIGMTAIIGAVALVVDFGVLFVIEREMQGAADAAALAAVWYAPVCDGNAGANPSQVAAGCQPRPAGPAPAGVCTTDSKHFPGNDDDEVACTVALQFAEANLGPVAALCGGPLNNGSGVRINPQIGTASRNPSADLYAVSIECDAPHWFGNIFPGLHSTRIATSAAAAIGWRGPDGDLASVPTPPNTLIARLVR